MGQTQLRGSCQEESQKISEKFFSIHCIKSENNNFSSIWKHLKSKTMILDILGLGNHILGLQTVFVTFVQSWPYMIFVTDTADIILGAKFFMWPRDKIVPH